MRQCAGVIATASILGPLAPATPASAATYHARDGASLQTAVASADTSSGSSTIVLTSGVFLPTSTMTITGDVTIVGPSSAPGSKLAGSAVLPSPSELFLVEAHAKLTLWNLDLTASGGEGVSAIEDYGAMDLESSTVAGNDGPGVVVQPGAAATVRNSTLSYGLDFGLIDDGTASVFSSTIAFNKNGGAENRGTLNLTNTIVAENTGSGDCEGKATTSDHSLDSDGRCGVGALSGMDPVLGRVMANGGPTSTQALGSGSPAIGAGDIAKCPAEDQRHFARPKGRCDVGSYETGAAGGAPRGTSPGTGKGSAPSSGGASAVRGVNAHGTLRGSRRSRIAFTVRAELGHAGATLLYTDRTRNVVLKKLIVRSLAIDVRRGIVTLRGTGMVLPGGRRLGVTLVLVSRGKGRSLRIRLSNGYYKSGPLLSGSIGLVR